MEPPVVAALISSGAALGIAVVGVIATGKAQIRATKHAHANALDLFDRQENAQQRAREADAAQRLRLAHLDDRRALYLRVPSAIYAYEEAKTIARKKRAAMDAAIEAGETADRKSVITALDDLKISLEAVLEATEALYMMAPKALAQAGREWALAVKSEQDDTQKARWKYLGLVRADLGSEEET